VLRLLIYADTDEHVSPASLGLETALTSSASFIGVSVKIDEFLFFLPVLLVFFRSPAVGNGMMSSGVNGVGG